MTSTSWNIADAFEALADAIPAEPAQRHGDTTFTWADFDRRADGVARSLLGAGLREQDKVAQYLYNGPEYLESTFAAFKAGLATVNTNYRYVDDELVHVWTNADTAAVVFHGTFVDRIEAIRPRVPGVKVWLHVDDGTAPCPDWAVPYETAAGEPGGRAAGPWGRRGEHLLLLYTGGTTGLPKGVMWQQCDLLLALDAANRRRLPTEPDPATIQRRALESSRPRTVPCAPLMHGTGMFTTLSALLLGGSSTTLTSRQFDPVETLDTVARHRINSISIVGDAFAKPLLRALDAEPNRWDISSLRVVLSSGVALSADTKAGLLRHHPDLSLVDMLGSSESVGTAANTTRAGASEIGAFRPGPHTRVITEHGRDVAPGSGERGLIAIGGHIPLGYYKAPEQTAATFRTIDGKRYSIPGDWAEVLADGSVKLLGRGNQCINTGGEKVFPQEVEECLIAHPGVADAAVVGLPDERFGQAVTALVQLEPGWTFDPAELIAHVKAHLAAFKAPKAVHPVDSLGRAANGKLDYRSLTAVAAERAASVSVGP